MNMEEINILSKQVYIGNTIDLLFERLGFLIGQRSVIAKEILDRKEDHHKNPDEYRKLMYGALDHLEKEIKELLIIK